MPHKPLSPTSGLDLTEGQMVPRKPPVGGAEPQGGFDQQDEHEQIVPEPTRESHPLRAQVIDIRDFVAAKLRVHDGTVLDDVKQRMWTRWLKGLDMLPMRSNFQDPVTGLVPSRKSVEHAIRYAANDELGRQRRTIENQRRMIRELQQRRTA